jgi:hypothetical protein
MIKKHKRPKTKIIKSPKQKLKEEKLYFQIKQKNGL